MEEEAWQTEHFNSRRIAHGRKGKSGGKRSHFDPRRAYGKYELRCPASAKLSTNFRTVPGTRRGDASDGILEIHGPAETRDSALICTFALTDVLSGVALLAGSRKSLASVVGELERSNEADSETREPEEIEEGAVTRLSDADDDPGNPEGDEDEADYGGESPSHLEVRDERDRSRQAAFEKNSFRSPKFWVRWRAPVPARARNGEDYTDTDTRPTEVEVNGGYLIFSSNDCSTFNGTISCDAFEWKNVKLSGRKITSKATQCPISWLDITS